MLPLRNAKEEALINAVESRIKLHRGQRVLANSFGQMNRRSTFPDGGPLIRVSPFPSFNRD